MYYFMYINKKKGKFPNMEIPVINEIYIKKPPQYVENPQIINGTILRIFPETLE